MATLQRPVGVVPSAPRRNPFKPASLLAKQYDAILKAYANKHHDVVRNDGTVRCLGNAWADHFWLGYDGTPPVRTPKNTLAWACYRAGQAQRLLDDRRNVYVAPTVATVPR